jgi:predicted GIY-YIG superfamily endonuclease
MEFVIPKDKGNYYLYFLELRDGYYYVGITRNLEKRLYQHCSGRGSVVTRKHKPLRLICAWFLGEMTYLEAQYIEDEFTIYFMSKYGGRVRGGRWCKNKENVKKILRKTIEYSPCEQYPIEKENQVLQTKIFVRHIKRRKRKSKKGKNLKGLSRDEKVKVLCSG